MRHNYTSTIYSFHLSSDIPEIHFPVIYNVHSIYQYQNVFYADLVLLMQLPPSINETQPKIFNRTAHILYLVIQSESVSTHLYRLYHFFKLNNFWF